ncbi:MAG: phage portal protein [Ruminococcus sp.]|nr:phage portal protein [Ruminococcus sp.]
MGLFNRKQTKKNTPAGVSVQTARRTADTDFNLPVRSEAEYSLYDTLRKSVPIIDAAIIKTVRLVGGFTVKCTDSRYQDALDDFVGNVKVGMSGQSLQTFVDEYLDDLITYGNAVGEIVLSEGGESVAGLCNAEIRSIEVREGKNPLTADYYLRDGKETRLLTNPALIVFTALNPAPNQPYGVSVLRGLPYLSRILMRIYESVGQNFDRVGNVRYAVTYKPQDSADKAFAKERAEQIANEWSAGMQDSRNGQVRDFVAVGDVDIKVIGAENQMPDIQIPVRQLLEQITAKLGIPPFLLGLNWSSTERMSQQQTDILTSELEYYRRLLTPMIKKICRSFLRVQGSSADAEVIWNSINLQDETELAEARLKNAQAMEIEARLGLTE